MEISISEIVFSGELNALLALAVRAHIVCSISMHVLYTLHIHFAVAVFFSLEISVGAFLCLCFISNQCRSFFFFRSNGRFIVFGIICIDCSHQRVRGALAHTYDCDLKPY